MRGHPQSFVADPDDIAGIPHVCLRIATARFQLALNPQKEGLFSGLSFPADIGDRRAPRTRCRRSGSGVRRTACTDQELPQARG